MKIRYFPDTDTLYIELADRASSSSEAVSDNLIVDFDEGGKPVGVTLEHYSQISGSRRTTPLRRTQRLGETAVRWSSSITRRRAWRVGIKAARGLSLLRHLRWLRTPRKMS